MLQLDPQPIAGLRDLLDDLQYDVVQRSLRPNYFAWPFPPFETFQQLITYLPERQRVSYEVLFLGRSIRKPRLAHFWGADLVEGLLGLGFFEPDGATCIRTANYSVVSFLGRYFVVSLNPYYPDSRDPDAAVYIGPDSLTLATNLPYRRSKKRGLDLCSGSGIQAILMAAIAREVTAVELNEEAVRAAEFNVILNGVAGRVQVHRGSLYEGVPDGRYDLIVSNPPFLPIPSGIRYPICGNGGEDGQLVLKPLLEGIPTRLANDGLALIYAEGVGDAEGPFICNLLRNLAQSERLDVQMLVVSRLSVRSALVLKAVSLSKLKPQAASELAQWRDLYRRLGATYTYNYVLKLTRGHGHVIQIMAFDPRREEQGIEVQPGVVVKPR